MSRQKKYHFIYRTTCKITGKFYVGMHSTDNLDDGYIGSGKILGYSRKKYGDENHQIERLEFVSSRDELKRREKEIVNEELLSNPLNINLKYGGEGGGRLWNNEHKNKFITAGQKALSTLRKEDIDWQIKTSKNISNAAKKTYARGRVSHISNYAEQGRESAKSPEALSKRRHTMMLRNHSKGENNSQYGKCWIKNDIHSILVKKEDLEHYLQNGYVKGRKQKMDDEA